MPKTPWIQVKGIEKSFAGTRALDGADLTVFPGEVHALVGENGSGKSTLIRVLAGTVIPDSGTIEVNGRVRDRLHPLEAVRLGIQVIYQDFSLYPNLSVAENLALNHFLARGRKLISPSEVRSIASAALGALGLDLDLDAPVEDLPVAGKQLVAICRAISEEARLIIMDEPTTALARREADSLFQVIARLKDRGVAILFVSHRLDDVSRVADRVTVLRNGRVVGVPDQRNLDPADLAYLMTGRKIGSLGADSGTGAAPGRPRLEPARLQVRQLTRIPEYREVSFEIAPGEILGLTGPLGSGQTALGLSLFGILSSSTGAVMIDGQERPIRDTTDAMNAGIGFVPEDRLTEGLFRRFSVGSNISVGLLDRFTGPAGLLNRKGLRREAAGQAEAVDISPVFQERPVEVLSGGNQQRVLLARWLAVSPRILILNNPTAGVDVSSKYELHRLFRKKADQGMGILWISDDLPELLENCARILIMRQGRIVETLESSGLDESILYRHVIG